MKIHHTSSSSKSFEDSHFQFARQNLDLSFNHLLLLAPLAMVLLFGFPSSALAKETTLLASREVRRRKSRQLEKTANAVLNSQQAQQFLTLLSLDELKKLSARPFPDISGNINISLMLTGADVSRFFESIIGSSLHKQTTVVQQAIQPAQKTLLNTINSLGNRPLTIRGGILGWGAIKVLKGVSKKVEKWAQDDEQQKPIQQIPKQIISILTDKTVQLAILAVLLYHSAVNRKLPAPVKQVVDSVFPTKKVTMGEWTIQKLQQSINFATSNAIYLVLLLILWTFRKQILTALFGQKEGVTGAINTVMDFVREQHKTILQYGRDMMKTTTDWGNRFYNQVSAYNQRDLDQLVEKNKEIRSLHEKVADTQKIVHELDKHQEIQKIALQNCNHELLEVNQRTRIVLNQIQDYYKPQNEIDAPPELPKIEFPETIRTFQVDSYDTYKRLQEVEDKLNRKK